MQRCCDAEDAADAADTHTHTHTHTHSHRRARSLALCVGVWVCGMWRTDLIITRTLITNSERQAEERLKKGQHGKQALNIHNDSHFHL